MKEQSQRSGIIAGGNFIVDSVQMIDHWPDEEGLALVEGKASLSNGGGPYNVLSDLSRLGADFPISAIGRIGEGDFGTWILNDCASKGIDTRHLIATPGSATSYTHVMTDRQTGRRTFFHNKGANSQLKVDDFDFRECNARFFYLGYLLLLDQLDAVAENNVPAAYDVLERARQSRLTTVLDCVSEDSNRFQTVVRPVLPQVDILFANDFEAEKLTGIQLGRGDTIDTNSILQAATTLLEYGVNQMVILHAPEGACVAKQGEDPFWQPSVNLPQDHIAGAVGAGDALAAGFIFGLHQGWSPREAIRLGVCAAAACLQKPGCSEGVMTAQDCLSIGEQFGYRF